MSNVVAYIQDNLIAPNPLFAIALGAIGLFHVSKCLNSLLSVIIDTLAPRSPQLGNYKSKNHSQKNWAVVTGSTAGIGEQYAHQLAQSGFNVALVSRSLDKLKAVAQEIEEKYRVKTEVFVLDAATAGASDYTNLAQFVNNLESVSVLINNLGISHEMPTPFAEVSESELQNIIQVNCVSTLEITRAVLPAIQESTKNSTRGLILTMGSFAGLTPTPLLSVYSGSKLFLQGWSSALAQELKPQKIDVQIVLSYLVTSNMSKIKRTSMLIPNPKNFVRATLRQIGLNGGAQERAFTLTPYWSHALMHWGIHTFVGVYSSLVAKINYNMHVDIRKRALRKKERQQKAQ